MVDTFNLYVSTSNDLLDERELVGHLATEIPVTLGWQINFSPSGKDSGIKQLVLDTDFHLVIFGEDIRAPIGYEWQLSRNIRRFPLILVKDGIARTIAGVDFLKHISSYPNLLHYTSMTDFRKVFLTSIGKNLLDRANYFELKSREIKETTKFIEDIEDVEPNLIDKVTGEDSIILTRERFMPRNGVLLQPPDDQEPSSRGHSN
jgi:hypothetical protein